MPDWFSNSARVGEIWAATLDQVSVRSSIRLTDAYGKHGTGVAVRLYVLDKAIGKGISVTLQRGNVAELLPALVVPERLALTTLTEKAPTPRGGSVSLFRSVRSKPASPVFAISPAKSSLSSVIGKNSSGVVKLDTSTLTDEPGGHRDAAAGGGTSPTPGDTIIYTGK